MASNAINNIIQHGIGLESTIGRRFVRDFGKAADGTITYKEFREKYRLTHADWKKVPQNTKLIETVKAERDRRAGNGGAVDTGGSSMNKNNVVELHGQPPPTKDDLSWVSDLARYRENLVDEKTIRKKYRLADDVWEKLGADDELIRAVEEESARRIRDGSCKREKSQQLITKAPAILDSIMSAGSDVSPRHKIDAIRTLDSFTGGPGATAPAADRFVISIVLSADGIPHTERYDKSIKPLSPGEVDPYDNDSIGTGMLAGVIAAEKSRDGGNGEPL